MPNAHVLIVDDERDIRELLSLTLSRMGLSTASAGTLQKAKNLLELQRFDVCLTDMRLPDGNGLELIHHMVQHFPHCPIAMITAYGDVQSAVNALKAGAFDFVSKPVDLSELRDIVQRGLLISANAAQKNSVNAAATEQNNQPLPEALAHLERAQIQQALELCRFNKTKAAAHLGITFRALRYKMDKLGMQ
jgi:two-component system, NtrC family, response regulator PilR